MHAELASTQSAPADPLVIGETFTIRSEALHEVRRINVYLPPGYVETPAARYPVLYMPDGGIKEDFLHVAGLVQVSVGNNTMRPFILVGVENTERRRDMTGPTNNPEDRKIAPRVGGSAAFRGFIGSELMPQVRARYRATAETAIVGESLAGLFVIETLLQQPDLFDTYIAFDPSLWWNDRKLLADAKALTPRAQASRRRLFIASSAEPQLAELAAQFAAALQAPNYSWLELHYEPMGGEQHSTIYHPAALRAFRLLFKPE
jgi:uncharacterized protein